MAINPLTALCLAERFGPGTGIVQDPGARSWLEEQAAQARASDVVPFLADPKAETRLWAIGMLSRLPGGS